VELAEIVDIRDRIAVAIAVGQACHQVVDEPCVYEDDIVVRLLGLGEQTLTALVGDDPGYRHARFYVAARNRYIDEAILAAVAAGVRQIAILDAGMHTMGYRNGHSGVRVFEVDRPDVLANKRRRLLDAGIVDTPTVCFVPSEIDDVVDRLEVSGFDPSRSSLILWFDMIALHPEDSVRALLRYAAECPAAQLIFDYVEPDDILPGAVWALGIREVTAFHPHDLADDLHAVGFDAVDDVAGEELVTRYTGHPLVHAIPVPLHIVNATHRPGLLDLPR
jgi:methyltransferase (TIGR00027 family)